MATDAGAAACPPTIFEDFPSDIQVTILSFLKPPDILSFGCTSRRSASLLSHPNLWPAMCARRWGSQTSIGAWVGPSAVPYWRVYRALDLWESLIGFWRLVGEHNMAMAPPLLLFEWGSSFITGYKVEPTEKLGSYDVRKTPFLWIGMPSDSENPVVFLCNGSRDLLKTEFSDPQLVRVTMVFLAKEYFRLSEFAEPCSSTDPDASSKDGRVMAEIYQYFANRTSPGSCKASRRQRRKERERLGGTTLIDEHYVKIRDCHPTPSRPLQGIWKGICQNLTLGFYLLTYDPVSAVICRPISNTLREFSALFCSTSITSMEFPFSKIEEDIYNKKEHIQPLDFACSSMEEVVSRISTISSVHRFASRDLFEPSEAAVEGRIWEYKSGTFGFGFLHDNFIIDLKRIVCNGQLLDTVGHSYDSSNS